MALSGSGRVLLGGSRLLVGLNGQSSTFDGQFEGAGDITKIGAGTLTLTSPPNNTGELYVASGRTRPMRGFKSSTRAHRFCRAYDEVRNYLRPATQRNQKRGGTSG